MRLRRTSDPNPITSRGGGRSRARALVVAAGVTLGAGACLAAAPLFASSAGAAVPTSALVSESGTTSSTTGTLLSGDTITVTFNEKLTVASSYDLVLTDGSNEASITKADSTSSTSTSSPYTWTLTLTSSTSLSSTDVEVLSANETTSRSTAAVTGSSGAWNLPDSGDLSGLAADGTTPLSRVIGGSNADLSTGATGVDTPTIIGIQNVSTPSLYGSTPEVFTTCDDSATEDVYNADTGALIADGTCGAAPNNYDYIPLGSSYAANTPIDVVDSYPGSSFLYVSASTSPPEVIDVQAGSSTSPSLAANEAEYTFDTGITCPANNAALQEEFDYIYPAGSLNAADEISASSVACGTDDVVVTFPVRELPGGPTDYEYQEDTAPITETADSTASSADPDSDAWASSTSWQVDGPNAVSAPSINSLSVSSSQPLGASGGDALVSFSTANATTCTFSVSPSATVTELATTFTATDVPVSETYCSSAGNLSVAVPANSTTSSVTYTLTVTATGGTGSPATQSVGIVEEGTSPATPPSNPGGTSQAPSGNSPSTPTVNNNQPGTPTTGAAPSITKISPATGSIKGGSRVVITGKNFEPHSSVFFGLRSATHVVVDSSTKITATSPKGSGTVTVSVQGSNGRSKATSHDRFAYANPLAPKILSLGTRNGTTAGGTRVVIVGSKFTLGSTVLFGSHRATKVKVLSGDKIIVYSPAGKGTVYVTVHTVHGTSAVSPIVLFKY